MRDSQIVNEKCHKHFQLSVVCREENYSSYICKNGLEEASGLREVS